MVDPDVLAGVVGIVRTILSSEQADVEINESTQLIDELDIHSTQFVDLIVELEDSFNIRIKNSEFPKLATVEDIVNLVSSRVLECTA
jgi:acyl carrier protein